MQPVDESGSIRPACDVLVAGGGVAGVAAAVSAARLGADVVLAERTDRLGGIGTRGMLQTLCGLYRNGGPGPGECLNRGIVSEVVSELERRPGTTVNRKGRVFVLSTVPRAFEEALVTLCSKQQNLVIAFGGSIIAVTAGEGRVSGVTLERGGESLSVAVRAVVDCTGSGEVSLLAGAEYDREARVQLGGYTVRLRGLSRPDASLVVKVPLLLTRAAEQGRVPTAMRFTVFSPGDAPNEGYVKFSVDTGSADERQAEADVRNAVKLLAEQLPFFRDAAIDRLSGILEREGTRVVGEYVLTREDVLSGRKFPDGVVRNAWPIELWDTGQGTHYWYPPDNDYYEIPFRCLRVKGFSNLLVAGRCISVSHEALGSTRVMGACMALGGVAGQAAAEMALHGRYPDGRA